MDSRRGFASWPYSVAADGPTGHAELNAVRAISHVDPVRLTGATLYTSTEPCARQQ